MDDGTVMLYGKPLGEILDIVSELKSKGVMFEWAYIPPREHPEYIRSSRFTFAEAKYATWFQLKYD